MATVMGTRTRLQSSMSIRTRRPTARSSGAWRSRVTILTATSSGLSSSWRRSWLSVPGVAVQLLKNIPNLSDVIEIVRGLGLNPSPHPSPLVEAAVDVIRTAIDFETLESRGLEVESAITVLECRDHSALPVLAALRRVKGCVEVKEKVRGLRVVDLEVGMRVAEDIVATNGLVLIGRGMVVTELLLDRLTNFARMIEIVEPVLAVPGARRF